MSVVLFCFLMHVPLRIEAVIKILTFRVFIFPYVSILIESSDAWPFSCFEPPKGHALGYNPLFAPSHPPCHSSSKSSRAQPQLVPQRPARGGALGAALACRRMQSLPRQVPALQCVPLPRSHAAACSHCLGMPQPCIVCRMHTSRLPAEHPTATNAFDCLTPHR